MLDEIIKLAITAIISIGGTLLTIHLNNNHGKKSRFWIEKKQKAEDFVALSTEIYRKIKHLHYHNFEDLSYDDIDIIDQKYSQIEQIMYVYWPSAQPDIQNTRMWLSSLQGDFAKIISTNKNSKLRNELKVKTSIALNRFETVLSQISTNFKDFFYKEKGMKWKKLVDENIIWKNKFFELERKFYGIQKESTEKELVN